MMKWVQQCQAELLANYKKGLPNDSSPEALATLAKLLYYNKNLLAPLVRPGLGPLIRLVVYTTYALYASSQDINITDAAREAILRDMQGLIKGKTLGYKFL